MWTAGCEDSCVYGLLGVRTAGCEDSWVCGLLGITKLLLVSG